MQKYLSELSWLALSGILSLSVVDTKLVMRSTYSKAKKGEISEERYSPTVKKALEFYVENYELIEP
jgi:hypothetical protein